MSDKEEDSFSSEGDRSREEVQAEIGEVNRGINFNTKILVTGGNGYLGSHIVKTLLDQDFSVKVSVKDLSDQDKYAHLKALPNSHRLEIVEGKLTEKDSWEAILSGCGAVIHCASPVPFKAPKQELEVIYPAVEGTLAILQAAVNLGINRIIMTSCFSSIKGGKYKLAYNEDSWGEPQNVSSIERSKIFSERAAWFFHKENPNKFALTTICPGFLLGPCLQNQCDFSSGQFFERLIDGKMTNLLKLHMPVCDVRDAAMIHVNALGLKSTEDNRYICAEGSYWFEQFSTILSQKFEPIGFDFPTKTISAFPLRIISMFDSNVRQMLPFYDKEIYFSNERTKKDFCDYKFRKFEDTIKDMGICFMEKGFISRVKLTAEEEVDKQNTEFLVDEDRNDNFE